MKAPDFRYLGYLSKTIGHQGALQAFFDGGHPSQTESLESVFISLEGKLIPFFVDHLEERGGNQNEVVLQLEDVNDIETARPFCGNKLYIPSQIPLQQTISQSFIPKSLEGYQVWDDRDNKLLGTISCILEFPGNPVFQILSGNREILIPAAEEFIKKINHANRTISLTPPEGLTDLYQ